MKLIVTADKKLHFSAIGSVAEESWKNRQEEKLIVEIRDESGALITVDSGTLKVKLKATKSATTLLAQCTSFSVASAIYTGWLNLNTDACNALTQSKVLIEVSWEVSSHVQCSDDAEVYIIARTATGDEGDPETTSHLVTAQWLAAHILGGTGITITSDESAGTITIAGTLASQAEAEAGLLNTKLMTPLRVAQAIAALAAGGGTWGDITGTLADQTDLQAALDAKLNTAWVDTFGPAPLDSPAFIGDVPTHEGVALATIANIPNLSPYALLDSPAFIGTPTISSVAIATLNDLPSLTGRLLNTNNLSDVSSASTSRTNLGLGSIATQAADAIAITAGTITGLTNLGVALASNTALTGFALGTLSDTTSRPFSISQTWNNSGLTATALKVSVTNTSSNSASKIIDFCGGASGTTSLLSLSGAGHLTAAGNIYAGSLLMQANTGVFSTGGLALVGSGGDVAFSSNFGGKYAWAFRSGTGDLNGSSDAGLAWTGTAANPATAGPDGTVDVKLVRDAASVLALKLGTTAQTLRVYGTTTGSKYLNLTHDGTNAKINSSSGDLHISNLPTSNPGPGILWNNAGTPAIGT